MVYIVSRFSPISTGLTGLIIFALQSDTVDAEKNLFQQTQVRGERVSLLAPPTGYKLSQCLMLGGAQVYCQLKATLSGLIQNPERGHSPWGQIRPGDVRDPEYQGCC